MIVTRQRKKKQSSLPILLPIAAIAMLAIALTWPPSRNFITNGPLKPVATVFDAVWGTVSRPLSFAYQQQQITDRNQEIKTLNDQLESRPQGRRRQGRPGRPAPETDRRGPSPARAERGTRGRRSPARRRPRPAAAPVAAAAAATGFGRGAPHRRAVVGDGSPKAAALVQKLPTDYVSSVFAQMSPDAVGPIMDALPPKVAALIVESGTDPQLSAQPGR